VRCLPPNASYRRCFVDGHACARSRDDVSYSYAYPHKTAYRRLLPEVPLRQAWQAEDCSALFLYLHVPFCEFRCGFCNLFTQANPSEGLPGRYLKQLRIEAEQLRAALPPASFARMAIGGGTPTFLEADPLAELFEIARLVAGESLPNSGCEASPATVTAEKLAVLREHGVERLSLGVQSFDEEEAHRLGRPQRRGDVERAIRLVREAGFPILNLDLIYGGEGQSPSAFAKTVQQAIAHRAEEIYLYPLYVRPLTGLGQRDRVWDDERMAAYETGREVLLEAGYAQVSMRMFRASHAPDTGGPVYCCQSDGMVGLGCGARSYTQSLHYSREYAVGRQGVAAILGEYLQQTPAELAVARHGFRLPRDEQQRRFAILSLLQASGLSRSDYRQQFASDPVEDLPQLRSLSERGWAVIDDARVTLTPLGLAWSDAIGPWLYSPAVQQLCDEYEAR
jgi:oxygen-independent coproporphyrinogen-3 oxidase